MLQRLATFMRTVSIGIKGLGPSDCGDGMSGCRFGLDDHDFVLRRLVERASDWVAIECPRQAGGAGDTRSVLPAVGLACEVRSDRRGSCVVS